MSYLLVFGAGLGVGALFGGRPRPAEPPVAPSAPASIPPRAAAPLPAPSTAAPTAAVVEDEGRTPITTSLPRERSRDDGVVAFSPPRREPKLEPAEPPPPRKTEPSRGGKGLDPATINATIQKRLPGIQAEYSAALKRDRRISGGKVTVRFTISANGDVRDASVVEDTVGSQELANAILARVRSWKFKRSDGDATVIYPFVFVSSLR